MELKKIVYPQVEIDRLKKVHSVVTPEVALLTPLLVGKVISNIVDMYNQFIPVETLSRLEDLPERVIVTDVTTFNTLTSRQQYSEGSTVKEDGRFRFDGNYICIKNPESMEYVWEKFSPDSKADWINAFGSEQNARKRAGLERYGKVLIHETLHGFHPSDGPLSRGFIENGVNFYSHEVAKQLGIVELSLFDIWEMELYRDFLHKQSEKVHKVFFGTESNPEQVTAFMNEYTENARKYLDTLQAREN